MCVAKRGKIFLENKRNKAIPSCCTYIIIFLNFVKREISRTRLNVCFFFFLLKGKGSYHSSVVFQAPYSKFYRQWNLQFYYFTFLSFQKLYFCVHFFFPFFFQFLSINLGMNLCIHKFSTGFQISKNWFFKRNFEGKEKYIEIYIFKTNFDTFHKLLLLWIKIISFLRF